MVVEPRPIDRITPPPSAIPQLTIAPVTLSTPLVAPSEPSKVVGASELAILLITLSSAGTLDELSDKVLSLHYFSFFLHLRFTCRLAKLGLPINDDIW